MSETCELLSWYLRGCNRHGTTKIIPYMNKTAWIIALPWNFTFLHWLRPNDLFPLSIAVGKRNDLNKHLTSLRSTFKHFTILFYFFFSSPEPAPLRPSVHPHFQRSFFWNRLANRSQILYEAPIGRTKVYINNPGHTTKMAAIPIYGKSLQKSSPEPVDRFQRSLAWNVDDSKYYNVYINRETVMTLTYFTARSTYFTARST